MDKLDEKSAAKFISALVKSVQALCHGYLDFHNGVEIIGHINLSVDKESSLHYILEEKVCKSEENSTMFISNSFYAQKAEVQTKEKGCENILSGSNTVHRTDPIDVSEVSRVSPAVSEIDSLPSWHEKSQSASTSSANETDLSCKNPPTPAKRKVSCESSVKFKAKASRFISGSGEGVTPPPHRLAISSLEDGKPLRKELQIDGLPENSLLPDGKNKDIVNDLGISLVGSVLERVSEHTNSDSGRQDDVDSDGDLEVTFIKKEFLDEEQSSCLPENSCRFQRGVGTEQKASSSSAMSDSSGFSASHSHPTAASSTYVPSAHSLDIASTQLYGPSTSCQPHQGTSFGSGTGGEKGVSGQLRHSSQMGFMVGEASYTPPLAHHAHSSVTHPALGLSVLDLSIKTEPRDPDFLMFNCEQRRKKNSLLFRSCPGSRSEESRQKAKERSKEYRLKQKIHRMTDSTYDMIFRHQVAERKRRQRMRERIKKLKLHSVTSYSIAK